jgi:hypothetical protein
LVADVGPLHWLWVDTHLQQRVDSVTILGVFEELPDRLGDDRTHIVDGFEFIGISVDQGVERTELPGECGCGRTADLRDRQRGEEVIQRRLAGGTDLLKKVLRALSPQPSSAASASRSRR